MATARPFKTALACLALASPVLAAPALITWARADENSDLGLIPQSVAQETDTAPPAAKPYQLFAEDAVTGWSLRSSLPVPTPLSEPDWQDRLSLDWKSQFHSGNQWSFQLSDRLNGFAENDFAFGTQQTARNELREAYATFEPWPRTYLEAGRINIRNGEALGFNPTDYFKTRTLVSQASQDPSTLRNDRLGTAMVFAQKIWDHGAATVALAPKLQSTEPIPLQGQASLDPAFGQTNDADRWLASLSVDAADLSPQALFYHDDTRTQFGLNLSHVIGSSIVGYAEWSGGPEQNLSARAIAFGESTGALPAGAPVLPQSSGGSETFQNDLAAGASWTGSVTRSSKLSVNLEYHYHQSGVTGSDMNRWVSLGSMSPLLASELWYVREYASDQQEPWMQQEIFLRLDWPDFALDRLDLGWIAFVSPYDGSSFEQLSGVYAISDAWTLEGYLGFTFGGPDSVYATLPQQLSGVVQARWYL